MILLNSGLRVQTRDGRTVMTMDLQDVWSGLDRPDTFDPGVLYDPHGGRWIFVAAADPFLPSSSILLGISLTDDPTEGWNLWGFEGDREHRVWVDRPVVGFSDSWIAVQVNTFDAAGEFVTSRVFVFEKGQYYEGTGRVAYVFVLPPDLGASQVPAVTLDPGVSDLHFLMEWEGNRDRKGVLRLLRLFGDPGDVRLGVRAFVTTSRTWEREPRVRDLAPQLGTARGISVNDSRLVNVVYRNGSLFATHTVFLPPGAATRSSVQWWQIDPTDGSVLQQGLIDDPSGSVMYAFPSIAVNKDEDVLIGYSQFSSETYASAAYSFRAASDLLDTVRSSVIFKAGESTYIKTYGVESNRWGDYSASVVDPVDDRHLWTLQEYAAEPRLSFDRWGTWWARVDPSVSGMACHGRPLSTSSPEALRPGRGGAPGAWDRLFATLSDGTGDIVELDPQTGAILNRLPAPLSPGQEPNGLAYDREALWVLEDQGGQVNLFEVDPDTGEVRDADSFPGGTGEHQGLAALGDYLYFLNVEFQWIEEYDPHRGRVRDALRLGDLHPEVRFGGGLAAMSDPDTFFLAGRDAEGDKVFEVAPGTGALRGAFTHTVEDVAGLGAFGGEVYVAGRVQPRIEVYLSSGSLEREMFLASAVHALGSGGSPALGGGGESQSVTATVDPQSATAYRVEICESGRYTFTLCSGGGTATVDTSLCLFNDTGGLVADNDDACGALSEVSAFLVPGRYSIAVAGDRQGEYTLAYFGSTGNLCRECNGRRVREVGELSLGPQEQFVRGTLAGEDADGYGFSVCDAGSVSFSLCGDGGRAEFAPWLCVLDASGGVVEAGNVCNGASAIQAELGPGSYSVAVSAGPGVQGSYRLSFSWSGPSCLDAEGKTLVPAGVLEVTELPQVVSGNVGAKEAHVYTFELCGPEVIHLSFCSNGGGAPFNTALAVLDSSGVTIAHDDNTCGELAEIHAGLRPGSYMLLVSGQGGFWGTYSLSYWSSGVNCVSPEETFIRGDTNCDGCVDIEDAEFLAAHLGESGGSPCCEDAADANDDGVVTRDDVEHIRAALSGEGDLPSPGMFVCGGDLTADGLSSAGYDGGLCGVGCQRFLRGDCDGSGAIEGAVTDAIRNFRFCFGGGSVPCERACDADGDGNPCSGVTDGLRVLQFVFRGGLPMPGPFPVCGTGSARDRVLRCVETGCP